MLWTNDYYLVKSDDDIITEDAGVVAGGIIALSLLLTVWYIIWSVHVGYMAIVNQIRRSYDDDYMKIILEPGSRASKVMKVYGKVNALFKWFTKRGKFMNELFRNNEIIAITNFKTAAILKQSFGDIPLFNNLFSGKKVTMSAREYIDMARDTFTIRGKFRLGAGITWDSVQMIFPEYRVDAETYEKNPEVRANLYYLALLLRQMLVFCEKDMIREIMFDYKKIDTQKVKSI